MCEVKVCPYGVGSLTETWNSDTSEDTYKRSLPGILIIDPRAVQCAGELGLLQRLGCRLGRADLWLGWGIGAGQMLTMESVGFADGGKIWSRVEKRYPRDA